MDNTVCGACDSELWAVCITEGGYEESFEGCTSSIMFLLINRTISFSHSLHLYLFNHLVLNTNTYNKYALQGIILQQKTAQSELLICLLQSHT